MGGRAGKNPKVWIDFVITAIIHNEKEKIPLLNKGDK